MKLDMEEAEKHAGPFETWAQRCHAVSLRIVQAEILPEGARVARGWCKGVGSQHSWIALGDPYGPDVEIIDPTLWSYDDDIEGVWYGSAAAGRHVPHGGRGTIWTWGRPPSAVGPAIALTPSEPLSAEAEAFLDMLGPLDLAGWHILLSQAPVHGWPAAEIVAAADDTNALQACIPIDRLGMLTNRNPDGVYLPSTYVSLRTARLT